MKVVGVSARDFRGYRDAKVALGEGLTVVSGPNGAGKTNLLEALYFGCTGRSCRTSNEREIVRFGQSGTRVVVDALAEDGPHQISVGLLSGQSKRMRVDGALVDRLNDVAERPLVSVFLPDRLALIKGPPALRRAHLDQLIAVLWPGRAGVRRQYAQTLAQRNALLARFRSGMGSREALASWDAQLARHGVALIADRARAVAAIADRFHQFSGELGRDVDAMITYRPRSHADRPEDLARELAERTDLDLERGFTGHGPHRDEIAIAGEGRDLRTYGSQGQQRVALLALLLAERQAIFSIRNATPLMLLDDVMSELDRDRRGGLVELLGRGGGQAVITTTDLGHVPRATDGDVVRVAVSEHVAQQNRSASPAVGAAADPNPLSRPAAATSSGNSFV